MDSERAWKQVTATLDQLALEVASACRGRQVRPAERSRLKGRGWILDFWPGSRLQLLIDWRGTWRFMLRPEPQPGANRILPNYGPKKISAETARQIWLGRGASDLAFAQQFTEQALRQRFLAQLGL